ncbi:hypothetical protein ACJJTC_001459 [Scirpophaga incertulas]
MIWVPNQSGGCPSRHRRHRRLPHRGTLLAPYPTGSTTTSWCCLPRSTPLIQRRILIETYEVDGPQPPDGDFGNYRCISKNSLGETEGSIRHTVKIPMPSTSPKATEMKSNANKESARRANASRAVQREGAAAGGGGGGTERPSVLRAQLDRAADRDAAHHLYRPPHTHHDSDLRDYVLVCGLNPTWAVFSVPKPPNRD